MAIFDDHAPASSDVTGPAGQAARAERLRALHRPGDPLVLVNVWDVASARVVEAAGAPALATASQAVAAALGRPDGEGMSRDAALAAVARIAAAVGVPLTADLEAGYGRTPDDVALTVAGLVAAGGVGCNLEDSLPEHGDGSGAGTLRDLGEQVERLAAARAAATSAGVPVVINARVDALGRGGTLDDAVRRGTAYLAAGADCAFVLGVAALADVRRLADAFDGRLSLIVGPGSPPLADLAAAGVCRVSVGPGAQGAALAALSRTATTLLAGGGYPDDLAFRPPA